MGDREDPQLKVEGTVAPGFESVRERFASDMATSAERNAQLCVYHRGEQVVDLWATAIGDDAFSPDSLVNVFSSGKSLESIALAALIGKGLLDYRQKISEIWPEFAANGKEDLTVADLMRHETGLAAFDTSLDPADLLAENIKKNQVGRVIEAQPARFAPGGGRREYHALTRGWIANEVFRRVDPAGRTIGEFLREEVAGPLEADVKIGLRESERPRVSRVVPLGLLYQFLQSFLPRALGRRIKHNFFQLFGRILRILPAIRKSTTRRSPPPFVGWSGIADFNDPAIARGETPSANAHGSARGLARLAAALSGGGTWRGTEILSRSAWEAMHAEAVPAEMLVMPTAFTQGGVNAFSAEAAAEGMMGRALNAGREGFFGWMGFGGSIFQWHPGHDIGFAFVPTSLHALDLMNERGKAYQREVLRCVERLGDG